MKYFKITLAFLFVSQFAFSQKIFFPKSNYSDSIILSKGIAALAEQTLMLYKEPNELYYLDDAFRLQLLSGKYAEVITSLKKLSRINSNDTLPTALAFPYLAYSKLLSEHPSAKDFKAKYEDVFYRLYNPYNEDNKLWVSQYFDNSLSDFKEKLNSSINDFRKNDSLSISDAVKLCRNYLSYNTYAHTQPIANNILSKIESEKYIIQDSVIIKMPDGGSIALTIVRDRKITAPMPVIMMYNIYAGHDISSCKDAASRGYIGIVADTRGKRLSVDAIEPFEHDAKDAYHIIDWISKQLWCNGKVGMYGGSYLGFSQWAAAKYLHPALKTIVPQVSVAAGVDYPMHNGVFMNFALRWIHFVTDNKLLDRASFTNLSKWDSVNTRWYKKGLPFRLLDSIEGRPDKIFQKWLQHPAYDTYWQNMTPQKEEFAKINIPIFTTTGYWDDDQTGAMYYYKQYHKWNKNPNYYLLIGPYDHGGSQAYPKLRLNNYKIDSVANIPILDIVFKWFDYTLKDSSKPSILKDKVTFEMMGTNQWKSVATLKQMANDTLTLYPVTKISNGHYGLTFTKPYKQTYLQQTVDLNDRKEILLWGDETAMGSYPLIIDSIIRCEKDKLIYISDPIRETVAISGALQASLVASINKKDMDIVIDLFEQTPDGKYFALSQNIQRASYANDRSKRQLLTPNKIETIPITNTYITCKQLQKGSRIVIVMGINKNPNWQINYGTGKDVSSENIADAKEPFKIKWYNTSCIMLPILRQ